MESVLEDTPDTGYRSKPIRYGFTGTRSFNERDHGDQIIEVVEGLKEGCEYTTGGCRGVDAYVGLLARCMYPTMKHRVVLPSDKSQLDPDRWWHSFPDIDVVQCPEGTDYRLRNEVLVHHSDVLYAFPYRQVNRPYSGTWMTVNIARKKKIPVVTVILP